MNNNEVVEVSPIGGDLEEARFLNKAGRGKNPGPFLIRTL